MVRHGTHGRSTAARPPHPLTHKKTRPPRTPTCSPRPCPFPEKPPRLCPAPKNCRRRTFVAPQTPRRRAAPARGPRTVVCLHRPNRNAPQQARPLLVGRVCVAPEPKALAGGTAAHAGARPLLVGRAPSLATTAPTETHRSLSAPCSWGRQASPRSQRHWPAAPPPHPSPPKTVAGGRPLLVGLSPSAHSTAPTETHRSRPAPCSWGGSASPRSQRHWPPALPA